MKPTSAIPFLFSGALVFLAAAGSSVSSAAIVLTSLSSDASALGNNTVSNAGDSAIIAGRQGGSNRSAVFVFQLPTLLPGQTVANASFTVRVVNGTAAPTSNLDLYGLAFRTSDAVVGTDYYSGALDSSSSATLIADSFRTPSGIDGNSVISPLSLTNYINAQIAAGAVTGNYIFLRASSDAALSSNSFYYLASNENSVKPQLTFDIVPEPATALLVPVAAMGLALGRKRRPH